jgi:regulator of protease activity HflC (stomatin/prohibitin superfamily)
MLYERQNMFVIPFISLIAFVVITVFIILWNSIYLVQQAQVIIIERLGKFNRVLYPGFNLVNPFFDKARTVYWTYVIEQHGKYYRSTHHLDRIDLRESVYDFPKQNVITRDNVTMEINALLYYQIMDPKKAVYEVSNLPLAIEKLTQTTLRNVIGSMDLDESLVSRDQINEKLTVILDEATDKWGVKVNRVELQEVNPPADIRHAMEKQMRAERDRRAIILEAEGKKRAAILEAEGEREAAVLAAKGQAEARLTLAQAEAKSVEVVHQAVPGTDPLPYMIATQYIRALPSLTEGKDTKMIVVPYEASSLVASLASMKKIFEDIERH